jgi:hypothetical protein
MPGLELSSPRALPPALLLFLGVGIGALYAADGPPAQGIPYQGRLELAGQPYSGTQTLSFRIWDGPDTGTATLLHQEEQSPSIARGAFGVVLGESGLPDAVFTSADLYLQVGVGALTGANWLAGVQRILPAAQSVRAGRAFNFDIEGPVVTAPADFRISNGTGAIRFGNGTGAAPNNQVGDVSVTVGTNSQFTVRGANNSNRLVLDNGSATLGSALDVSGDLDVSGALRIGVREGSCPITGSGAQECFCDPGEMVIGGGTRGSNSDLVLVRESRPVYDAANERYGWRVICSQLVGAVGSLNMQNANCSAPVTVTCARLQPDN